MNSQSSYDAVVVGGGPSGSAASTILAQYGHKVVVLEREKFPRYHIGESLIPFTFPALERMGLVPFMKGSEFIKKYSVVFVSPSGRASQPFYFFNRYDRETIAQTWQVLRSEFDEILLNNARSKGVEVHEETEVTEFIKEDGKYVGVKARNKAGEIKEYRAPFTVDATGRSAMAANANGWRRGDPKLNKVAAWTYYKGAKRDDGIDAGATTVAFIPNKGWFWYIPQHNDIISVGVVADGKYLTREGFKDPKAIFEREIKENKWIEEHLAQGVSTGEYRITGEYTYRSEFSADDGLVLVGDAYGFLDPVFSSGLMLALKSGCGAADAIHEGLLAKDYGAHRFIEYSRVMKEGIENMRKLVYAFYDPNVSFRKVTNKGEHLHGALTDCLSGDVNKDFSEMYAAFGEFTTIPDDLPFGKPRLKGEAHAVTA
ncbi:MAG TPA: NAD(P)/FAD-dependent oxidoreductase [Candidatus Limnocylindria bacterium]|nr:NAD(P)/FAD-dependent oxidoreductase [Candidatus Limnocylindria bacterium]